MLSSARVLAVAALAAALVIFPVSSQAQDAGGNIAQTVIVDPLPGHGLAFEEGMKAHQENMIRAGDESVWVTFEIVAGERSGQFMVGSFGHDWADFDQAPPVDPARAQESMADNIAPHVQDFRVQWMERLVDLGGWTLDTPQAPMYEVVTFQVDSHASAHRQVGAVDPLIPCTVEFWLIRYACQENRHREHVALVAPGFRELRVEIGKGALRLLVE